MAAGSSVVIGESGSYNDCNGDNGDGLGNLGIESQAFTPGQIACILHAYTAGCAGTSGLALFLYACRDRRIFAARRAKLPRPTALPPAMPIWLTRSLRIP